MGRLRLAGELCVPSDMTGISCMFVRDQIPNQYFMFDFSITLDFQCNIGTVTKLRKQVVTVEQWKQN